MFTLEERLVEVENARSFSLRGIYLLGCVGVSAYSLGAFVQIIQSYVSINYSYQTEGIMVIAQVGFQWLFMMRRSWKERVRYMYVALTVSMIGSVMLLPLLLIHSLMGVSGVIAIGYFFVVVGIIFAIHHRLIIRSALPKVLSVTWVLYRLLLLAFVLFPHTGTLSAK
jgi:hypothetical protein